ncbi:MAG: glycoside hydrolase [bacterium]
MRTFPGRVTLVGALLTCVLSAASAQTPDPGSAMHWRQIGPSRAGRARTAAGVPSQPNVFYVGFDNGGVWRSTDYGSNWVPLFDAQPTGSIGAIAIAPSDPNVIYVGTGAGIIRPDLAVGDGMYKSVDAGKTWTHLGLRESQMIAYIDVDPKDPNRLFVAVLGHPYGPNAERGIFRSTDGGATFQKVLYQDEYTSGDDVRIEPSDPNTVYAALWPQQQGFSENGSFTAGMGGVFKSTDGGTTWNQLKDGLPAVLQANLAIAPSNPKTLYATVAPAAQPGGAGGFGGPGIGLYKSTDGGAHWRLATADPSAPAGSPARTSDNRPLARIGGGDLPTIVVDPKNENVVYSSSTVMWRTEDGGLTWTAVRGAPGGDDYQRTWINPNNTDIILAVADQGAVISGNRGVSWSNWYTQPTAAMYHVTTDNAFPYRVCGGQQDSGSACVESRSMDGQITFHDWHPVNIQEYGIAAPDPRDPDMVFGSQRGNVSLYNRKTGQTTLLGPDMTAKGPNGEALNRNVRTMPIAWSPVNPDALYYASNVIWKTIDRGHSWTRISPDLARQTWAVPANAGRYAANVTPGPQGTITALSLSPRDGKVIWAGTDDGNIQVTTDGGTKWTNVTPAAIKPWTRIFNMDAGHFDAQTAYVAANTLRLDDLNPHFWRTHDGGKSWTEINTGVSPGAAVNSIREDPRQKGLLYGATDTQVWVSFDDGDHWQSLRNDMPAISVRDLQVKDDESCLCSDLIAGTHGRGFWILDNVTPLRQAAAVRSASAAKASYLVKPTTAVRVRFATNDPTPWPPEMPAGENPPPGAMLDYYLAGDATGAVELAILDAAAKVVRSYTSDDRPPTPDAGVDPVAYNKVCQQTPTAPHCAFPLYWAAPTAYISTVAGMHRFSWDMHFDPIVAEGAAPGEPATGAVPHRTYPSVTSPWAPPGQYTVRLTVDGKSYSQPLVLRLDPRVKATPAALSQLATLTKEMYSGALALHSAYTDARALVTALASLPGEDLTAFKAQVESLAPAPVRGGRGGRGGGGGRAGGAPAAPPTLETASSGMMTAAMAMQGADVAPTASQVATIAKARATAATVMKSWTTLSSTGLATLNAKRKAAGQPTVTFKK